MNITALIFAKIPLSFSASKILFCLARDKQKPGQPELSQDKLFLPEFDLAKHSPTQFAIQNHLIRHDKFDWHMNKTKPICYVFEIENPDEQKLPTSIDVFEQQKEVQWFIFPQAVSKLTHGTHRNLLQLLVQYISYGAIDESVIAADYDAEWLKSLPPEEDV